MKHRFLIIAFVLFNSCASNSIRKSNQSMPMTVDWSFEKDRSIPKIEKSTYGNAYGPVTLKDKKVQLTPKNNSDAGSAMALVLGPGGYRSLAHISLLKEMTLNSLLNIKPTVVVGHGLSAVIAAYYAFGYNPDFIEWKFFGFVRKVKDLEIYSDEWISFFKTELISDLEKKKIEESNLTLVIPVYDSEKKKVVYMKRGSLYESLLANIRVHQKKKLMPAFPFGYVDMKWLKKVGVESIVTADLLSNGISWKKGNGKLNGLFEKAASQYLKKKNKFQNSLDFPLESYAIDSSDTISKIIYISKDISKTFVNRLSKNEIKGQDSDTSKN